jgi:hypothetical protein
MVICRIGQGKYQGCRIIDTGAYGGLGAISLANQWNPPITQKSRAVWRRRTTACRRYRYRDAGCGFNCVLWARLAPPRFRLRMDRRMVCGDAYWSVGVTRQIELPRSSATNNAPPLSTATPTGLPHASPSSLKNPVSTSSTGPIGIPLAKGTKMTL